MDILIDNAYLHSVFRCFEAKARGIPDLNNFYRFIGEIISHKNIWINVNKKGTIYPQTIKAKKAIESMSSGKNIIRVMDQTKVNYDKVSMNVAQRMRKTNLNSLLRFSRGVDSIPDFDGRNPDIEFHKWLIGRNSNLSKTVSLSSGATYIPIIVVDKAGLWHNMNHKILSSEQKWSKIDSFILATRIRSWVYEEISIQRNVDYIPSITRGINSDFTFNSASIRSIILKEPNNHKEFKENLKNNHDIVSAIIARNMCNPEKCITDAFEIRDKTKKLRRYLEKHSILTRGDSIMSLKYEKVIELISLKDDYLKTGNIVFPSKCLNPTFSLSSDGQVFDGELPVDILFKIFQYSRKKMKLRRMNPILQPVLQAKLDNTNSNKLKLLKRNCGLVD